MNKLSQIKRPIALISLSTALRKVAFCLPCFLFPWEVHLRATLVILLGDILKTYPSLWRRPFFCCLNWLGICLRCVSPNLKWSWAGKSKKSYVSIHCEVPRFYGNPSQQLASTPIRTTTQI